MVQINRLEILAGVAVKDDGACPFCHANMGAAGAVIVALVCGPNSIHAVDCRQCDREAMTFHPKPLNAESVTAALDAFDTLAK